MPRPLRPLAVLAVGLAVAACGSSRRADLPGDGRGMRPLSEATIRSASDLVQLARATYGVRWYRTLTFVQTTTFYTPRGTRSETWHEAVRSPGRLRIDLPEEGEGNAVIVRGDSTYVFRGGELVAAHAEGNPLLLLGFDLYRLPTAATVAGMGRLGIDTTVVRRDTWSGRPAWVIGAAAGDSTSPQVWYDRERLVFLRLIERGGPGEPQVSDVRFERYEPLGEGWIAPRVEFYEDGRLVMTEDYRDIRADPPLDDALFSPTRWRSARWYE